MTLEERVMRLERSCRRWRAACVGAIAVGASAVVIGAAPNPAAPANGAFANLTASHLTIRNLAGGPALDISADGTQTALQINNPATGLSAALMVGKDGANLFLNRNGAKGTSGASVGVDDVSGSVALHSADGKSKVMEP